MEQTTQSTATDAAKPSLRDLLRIPDFRHLWFGQLVSNMGDALTYLTLIFLVNRVTDGSTNAIAGVLISLALPQATIGLVAGVLVDRWDRKRVMLVADLLRGGLVLGFSALCYFGTPNIWVLYGVAFLVSTVSSFALPAQSALTPNLVDKRYLMFANSLGQMTQVTTAVVGASLAGFLVGTLNTFWLAFLIDALTFFLSFVFISRIRFVAPPRQIQPRQPLPQMLANIGAEWRIGMRVIAGSRILIGTLAGTSLTRLGMGATNVLLTPLIVNELGVSESWFGAVELSQVTGMVLSGLAIGWLTARLKPTRILSSGHFGLGVMTVLLAAVYNVWYLFPLLFIVGLLITPFSASVSTLIQTEAQDEVRGRVSAVLGAVARAASLLSMFAAGALAAVFDVRTVFVISGLVVCVAGLTSAWIFASRRAGQAVADSV